MITSTVLIQKVRMSKQMMLYIQFLPFCDNETDLFKLLDEIQFLKLKIEKINRMKISDYNIKIPIITETIESNFDNL